MRRNPLTKAEARLIRSLAVTEERDARRSKGGIFNDLAIFRSGRASGLRQAIFLGGSERQQKASLRAISRGGHFRHMGRIHKLFSMNPEASHVLYRDGKKIMEGSEYDLWKFIHDNSSSSVSWALQHEGWKIRQKGGGEYPYPPSRRRRYRRNPGGMGALVPLGVVAFLGWWLMRRAKATVEAAAAARAQVNLPRQQAAQASAVKLAAQRSVTG